METAPPHTRPNWTVLVAFLALLFFLLWATVWMVGPYLLALLMGGIVALIVSKPQAVLIKKGWHPKLAGLLITGAIALLLIAPVIFMFFLGLGQATELAQSIAQHPDFTKEALIRITTHWKPLQALLGQAQVLQTQLLAGVRNIAAMAPGMLFKFFGGLPNFILQMILALSSCYYFLIDGTRFTAWLRDKLPLNPEVRSALFESFRETAVSSVIATLSAALAQTLIIFIGFLCLDVPAPFFAAGVTFILAWIPLVGTTPVWAAATIYLFVQGSTAKGVAMLAVGFITGVSDNVTRAIILKGRTAMHPLVGLLAIFGGIHLFGMMGVFVGPILAALLIAALDIWPVMAERFGFMQAAQIMIHPSSKTASSSSGTV